MAQTTQDHQSIFNTKGFKPVSVGLRLREIRLDKHMSIKTLAEKSGLSVNTLSLIEHQKSSPSVTTLEQLAQALAVPVADFFEPLEVKKDIICTRTGKRQEMMFNEILVEDCGLQLKDHPLQPVIVRMPPKQMDLSEPVVHSGYEFIFVLSGTITYYVLGESYVINSGDSLFFNAELPHFWQNHNDTPAVYLLLMLPDSADELPGEIHFSPLMEQTK
jgi:transcriptional regulator with XRE-family HTH domain